MINDINIQEVQMEKKTLLIYSALLHDVGKIIARGNGELEEKHPKIGEKYIKQFESFHDQSLLQHIMYHDISCIKKANLSDDNLAYVIAKANEIAVGIDRNMKNNNRTIDEKEQYKPLHSVFNVIWQNKEQVEKNFGVVPFDLHNPVRYPTMNETTYTKTEYETIKQDMTRFLNKLPNLDKMYIPSLLQWMERYWSQIPHDVRDGSLCDISLYDHSKITCAIATCVYDVLTEQGETNYRHKLFSDDKEFHFNAENVFLLTSLDMSGIQDFIYLISGENALKSLRTRSFYIELMLEVIVDELLTRLDLPRTNLFYTGGGHAYLLLPNCTNVVNAINKFHIELKQWFLDYFTTDLSVSIAYVPCSSEDLMNTNGEYRSIWQQLTRELATRKARKYTVTDIISLNNRPSGGERECKECLRSDIKLTNEDRCRLCEQIIHVSNQFRDHDYFVIGETGDLTMPFGKKLSVIDEQAFRHLDTSATAFIYTKNNQHLELNANLTANLWMCDYDQASKDPKTRSEGIASYANRNKGIKRLGVIRADVDDLGLTFVNGIVDEYLSISRTMTLSRQLSLFFKYELRRVLKDSKITVIYSGGDDLFLIGAWDDIVEKSVEIRRQFAKFTLNKLSFSAGIGLYPPKYPVAKMAEETGRLEEKAKEGTKNQLTLWASHRTYKWETFEREVFHNKLPFIRKMFQSTEERGKTFAYHLLNYFTKADQINIARLAYLLARSNIDDTYAQQIFHWIRENETRRHFLTALEYFIYEMREVET